MGFTFWHDWQFFNVNWIEFTMIRLSCERDGITGVSEIVLTLLGLHVRFYWTHAPEKLAAMRREVEQILQDSKPAPVSSSDQEK